MPTSSARRIFPHNIGLGAAHDPALIERIGAATAKEIRVTGQEWTFAPTVTVPQDYRWGRAYEGYSSDPELVSSYVGAMVRGLQGPPTEQDRGRQGARLDQAFPRRRRHARMASTRATRRSARSNCATSMARLTAPPSERCRHRHGQLLELAGQEDDRQQEPADRRAQASAWASAASPSPTGMRMARSRAAPMPTARRR